MLGERARGGQRGTRRMASGAGCAMTAPARRLGTAQTRCHHHHAKPLPLFDFVFFLLLWGKATGRTGGAPLRPCGGARRGRTGAGAGEDKLRAVQRTADHGGPRGGRKRDGAHARARRTRGERADPHGQGARGRARERPRLSCAGEAA